MKKSKIANYRLGFEPEDLLKTKGANAMTKIKMDYNSIVNQSIKDKFVRREVLTCFSYEMDTILNQESQPQKGSGSNKTLPTWEDIENLYSDVCEKCGEEKPYNDAEGGEHCACGGDFESQPQEIFEWWIVTEYLYNKLKAKGQPVLEWGNNCYWGRCTTGQGILLDHVISQICEEMEILDGQKYDWGSK